MTIDDTLMQHLAHLADPVIHVDFGAAQAQRRFAAHGDAMGALPTMETAVLDIAHLVGVPTAEHLVHKAIIVGRIVARVGAGEPVPVLDKDLFEDAPGWRGFGSHQAASLRSVGLCDNAFLPHSAHHIHPVSGLYRATLPHLAHP